MLHSLPVILIIGMASMVIFTLAAGILFHLILLPFKVSFSKEGEEAMAAFSFLTGMTLAFSLMVSLANG